MKNRWNIKSVLYSLLILGTAFIFNSCAEDDNKKEWGTAGIYMSQAVINDGGVFNDYFVSSNFSPNSNNYVIEKDEEKNLLHIFLGVYRSGLQSLESYSVQIKVDNEASADRAGDIFKDDGVTVKGVVLPAEAYTLPDKITVPEGARQATFDLTVDLNKLEADHPGWVANDLVLVVEIFNPSKYELNEEICKTNIIIDGSSFLPKVKANVAKDKKTTVGPNYIEIDLGASFPVEGFKISTKDGSTINSDIEFQVYGCTVPSTNSKATQFDWITQITASSVQSTEYSEELPGTTVNRVRINTGARAASDFDVEVYFYPIEPIYVSNVALYRNTDATAPRNSYEISANAVDGNIPKEGAGLYYNQTGRWLSNVATSNRYFEIDLAVPTEIDGFQYFGGSNALEEAFTAFKFMVWKDDAWVTVYDTTEDPVPASGSKVSITPVIAEKVRFENIVGSNGGRASVFQFVIFSTITLY